MSLIISALSVGFDRYAGLLRRIRTIALHDVSLRIAPGEVVAVFGASGAGKSLLASAILGALPANAWMQGRITLHGDPLRAEDRGRRIALAPQGIDALDPLLPVGRQIARFARLSGLPADAAAEAVRAVTIRYGLPPAALDLYPHQMSGGMARRAVLALATSGGAGTLIADEPTVGLDPRTVGATLGHLRALADEGRAVMVISHDMPAVIRIADRAAILRDGRLVEEAPASAVGAGALQDPYARALWAAQPANRRAAAAQAVA